MLQDDADEMSDGEISNVDRLIFTVLSTLGKMCKVCHLIRNPTHADDMTRTWSECVASSSVTSVMSCLPMKNALNDIWNTHTHGYSWLQVDSLVYYFRVGNQMN